MAKTNRFKTAIFVQSGASNPIALSATLADAIRDAYTETGSTSKVCEDPAVRLIAHQLAHLLGVQEVFQDQEVYSMLTNECNRLDAQAGEPKNDF